MASVLDDVVTMMLGSMRVVMTVQHMFDVVLRVGVVLVMLCVLNDMLCVVRVVMLLNLMVAVMTVMRLLVMLVMGSMVIGMANAELTVLDVVSMLSVCHLVLTAVILLPV